MLHQQQKMNTQYVLPILRLTHIELMDDIALLRYLVSEEKLKNPATASTVHDKLKELIVKMKTHLAQEDKNLYPPLLTHPDNKLKTTAWNFLNGQKPIREAVCSFSKKLNACRYQFNAELVEETQQLLSLMCKRIDDEKEILFPRMELLAGNF